VVNVTPRPLYPGKDPVPIVRRPGGPQGRPGNFFDYRAVKFGANKSVGNEGRVPFREELYCFSLKDAIVLNSAVDEKSSVVGCHVLWTGKYLLTFGKSLSPPSSATDITGTVCGRTSLRHSSDRFTSCRSIFSFK
jgi:hypothetical protein